MSQPLSRLRLQPCPSARGGCAVPVFAAIILVLVSSGCDRTPVVHDVRPREIPETGATVVTVRGDRFRGGTRVTLNGSVLSDTTVVDKTTLRATLPPSNPGPARIGAVTLPDAPSPTTVEVLYVDVTPPRVIGWEPAGALPPDATTNRIRVTFSEPIETGSLDLRDDAGSEVLGSVSRLGAVLVFAPSESLLAGRGYVASVYGVTDARDNAAASERLRFSIASPE
jgi:hypothetical protein